MKINQKGINLIKTFEGCKLKAYQDQGGVWTIGYGWAQNVHPNDVWEQGHADYMLIKALDQFEHAVTAGIGISKTTNNQFSAMVSLAYNVGQGNFVKSSLLKHHKAGEYAEAADSFLMWDKVAGRSNAGLARRRRAERSLYLEY